MLALRSRRAPLQFPVVVGKVISDRVLRTAAEPIPHSVSSRIVTTPAEPTGRAFGRLAVSPETSYRTVFASESAKTSRFSTPRGAVSNSC